MGSACVREIAFSQDEFVKRLEKVIGNEPLRAFARRADMTDGGLRRYLYEGTIPPIDRALKLAQAGGVSFEWLVFGVGDSAQFNRSTHRQDAVADQSADYQSGEFTTIPAYQVYASAGHGSTVSDEPLAEPMAFRSDWLRREGFDPAKMAVIRAKGDSMEPTINDGDVILVRLKNGEAPRDGLYVLRLDGGLFVKRLQFDLGGVRIISDNPLYKSRDLSKAELAELDLIGRVVWAGKKF
ncbi:MAG: LexA family transcriptional regulator [Aeromonas popoffii]|uniref:LexA family transcriptional regulator n=1 Tax=Aeromonas TaxID=642 RepID=UPI00073B322E|nr:XRE family transcriptional regulator [Aeromonas salmonicida]EKP0277954.1 LexA family transcriptional regulator [Aeromonas bestiarum]KTA82121.1 transcriptional regulator [Aeromonas salmonicida]MDE7527336.1 XRE family transcriptional regulator [Aeromonas salmonicida]MDE7531667.1 XRE family transcriptional regulator [Aeromonas salmonicida]MDM5064341.1 XRE family transcriptional regulator [Aeromonas salmonicida]